MSIQELVLDFVNVKGQELSSKVEENQSIEADLQQINDMWNSVQELVSERTKDLRRMVAELSDFEEDLGRLGDVLNYTEVCLHESENTKVAGYNGLQNQLAKLKVSLRVQCKFRMLCCSSLLRGIWKLMSSTLIHIGYHMIRNCDFSLHDSSFHTFIIRFFFSFPFLLSLLTDSHSVVSRPSQTALKATWLSYRMYTNEAHGFVSVATAKGE